MILSKSLFCKEYKQKSKNEEVMVTAKILQRVDSSHSKGNPFSGTYSTKVVESIGRDDKATRTKQERVDT